MKKKLPQITILALSLLLLMGIVASAVAASATNGQTDRQQGNIAGQQKAQTILKATSELTGLSDMDIRSQRAGGDSFAAIAESQGVSEQVLVDKVVAERRASLDRMKTEGKIADEQYNACLNNMANKIKANVERTAVGPKDGGQRGQQCHGKRQGLTQGQGQGYGRGAACGQCQANCPYYGDSTR